jgi:hypothetical protein
MVSDIIKDINEIERLNKRIIDNYNDLSKLKPIKFFEYKAMRLLFRLIYNQEKIIKILKAMYKQIVYSKKN